VPGYKTNANPIRQVVVGYANAAVTAAQVLTEFVAPCPMRIGAVVAYAGTAGTGGASTVLDVRKNGNTVWTNATDQPTLLATATGEFANPAPNVRAIAAGDRVSLHAQSVSTTGHARLMVSVALELA
jgi:hypothetical protein